VEHDAGEIRALQLAATDAVSRARLLADALERLAGMVERTLHLESDERAPSQDPLRGAESLWTTDQVATYLAVSTGWVRHAASSGRLPSKKIGGARRFLPEEIRTYARGAMNGPAGARVTPRKRRQPRLPTDS
jgi:excisionase family DNA binding protein